MFSSGMPARELVLNEIFQQKKVKQIFLESIPFILSQPGELAERSIAAVLKTVDCNRSRGSNP